MAVDPRVQPDDRGDRGWRWAMLDASAPDLGQTAVGVGVALVVFFGGLAVFRSSEPRFADTI